MSEMLTEREAWRKLAALTIAAQKRREVFFLCWVLPRSENYCEEYDGVVVVSEATEGRMLAAIRAEKVNTHGLGFSHVWPSDEHAQRLAFCRRMARLCSPRQKVTTKKPTKRKKAR